MFAFDFLFSPKLSADNDKVLLKDALPNGLRYLRWGGDGEAVQPEK
jgi:hypothetical protein